MTVSDAINRKIEVALIDSTWTSSGGANPVDNIIKTLGEFDHADIDDEIRNIVLEVIAASEEAETTASQTISGDVNSQEGKELEKEINKVNESLTNLTDSAFGDLADLTRNQVSNLSGFAKNPFQFMLTNFFKKFAKGAGIIALATIIFAAVQLIISELMKPGRFLDRRFKRIAADEIFLFNSREDVAELRQGFRTVTITTIPFLKGSQLRGQISGNLYNPSAIPMNRLDPRRTIDPIIETQSSSRNSKFFNRRNKR